MSLRQLIGTTSLQLEVKLQSDSLSLLLYSFGDQLFYAANFTESSLPEFALSLYQDLPSFFHYLATFAHGPVPAEQLAFQAPKLRIRDYVCGGQQPVEIELVLNLVEVGLRRGLLMQRVAREGLEVKRGTEKWTRQEAACSENRAACKAMRQEIRERAAGQAEIGQRIEQLRERKDRLQRQIRRWRQKLSNATQDIDGFNQNQRKIVGIVKPFSIFAFVPYHQNPFFECFKRRESTIQNEIDPFFIYSQLVAQDAIPSYGIWKVSFEVAACKYGMAIGVTSEENREKLTSFSQPGTACLCTRNASLYLHGIRTRIQDIAINRKDIIWLKLDHETSILSFHLNSQQLSEILLTGVLRSKRLYPFVELSHGDSIVLQQSDQ